MSRKQIRISIDDAIIVPSLAVDIPENPETAGDFLLRIKIYVEDPENIVQLRVRKNLLVQAFKEIDFFNQEQMQAYLITVSGTLDRREPLADISRHYNLSMFVTAVEVSEKPLDDIPASIQKLLQKDSQTPNVTEASASQPTPRRRSENITTTATLLPQFEQPQQPAVVWTGAELTLPTSGQAEKYLLMRPVEAVTTTGTSLLSQLTSSVSPLPPKKRQQDAGSSSASSSSRQVKDTTTQAKSPVMSQPESSSSSSSVSQCASKEKDVSAISDAGEASSSKATTSQTTSILKKRSLRGTATSSSAEVPKSSISTSQKQRSKRQRDTDDDQEEAEGPARRSARIRKQTDKPAKYSK